MKKILSVSILAMLAVAPLAANATPSYHYDGKKAPIGTTTEITAQDKGIAAVGYVKGAYNAAVDVVSEEYDRATDAENALSTRIGTLSANGNYMDKDASVSANLAALDGRIKTNTDHIGTWTNLNNSGALANGNNADLVTAVNALNSALGSAGTDSTVGTGGHYVGIDNLYDQDNQANSGDENTVANNIMALDRQVYANEQAIDTLNANDANNANSVRGMIKDNAENASYTDSTTNLGASTIQGAITAVDTRLDTLEGDGANSVLGKIKDNAASADFATTNGNNTNFTAEDDTITEAIDRLDTVIKGMGSSGTIANQIKTQAEDADFTNTNTGIRANTIADAITEVASRQVLVYTSWGTGGAPEGAAEVALVDPGAADTINNQ